MKIQKGSRNVYADLGMAGADGMLAKAQLATKIGRIIRDRKLGRQEVAKLLNINQANLSMILRGNFRGIFEVNKSTLATMDSSMANLKKGKVSKPIDLSAFSARLAKKRRHKS